VPPGPGHARGGHGRRRGRTRHDRGRPEGEAERFRGATGRYPESEGFKTLCVDLEGLRAFLDVHECSHVAMPEPWTGEGVVDHFEAAAFIGMLEESAPA
jgi:hypothetical protein